MICVRIRIKFLKKTKLFFFFAKMQTRGIRIIDDQDFGRIDSDILLPSTSMVLQWFSCNKVTYRYILLTYRSHFTYIQF